ncbi:MAG TPA: signal peptidase I, partial [Ktedonobacteraceae bacterium]|nr:signal peptidase I [Ktedonobacteraceae bacterium]
LILVDKWTYLFRPPARGDVIVFVAPPTPSQDYIKRVIGLPGDTITIENTTVIVDGVTLNESYVDPNNQGNQYAPIINRRVPPNQYFVLGDNRKDSSDSRAWGFVPRKNIIGRAAFVYWPLHEDNDGFLPNVSSVFASIHQGSAAFTLLSYGIPLDTDPVVLLILPVLFLVVFRVGSLSKRLVVMVVSTAVQIRLPNLDTGRFRRPRSVRPARVPSAFGQVSSPGAVRERTRAGTCPRWTSDSPTTLTCMLTCIRAWPAKAWCPSTGFFPPTCSRRERVASTTALGSPGRRLLANLPMPLAIERAVHIHARKLFGTSSKKLSWLSRSFRGDAGQCFQRTKRRICNHMVYNDWDSTALRRC